VVWWLAAAVLAFAIGIGATLRPPRQTPRVDLTRTAWEGSSDARSSVWPALGAAAEATGGSWHPVSLDSVSEQLSLPATDARAWLRTRFTLPSELATQELFVFLGWTYSGVRTLYVNGVEIASSRHTQHLTAVPTEDILGAVIPRGLIAPGENEISLRIDYVWAADVDLTDPRFLLGPRAALERFYLLNWSLNQIFRRGAVLLLLGLCVVLVALTRMTRDPIARRIQWTASALMLAVVLMLETSAGELIPALSPNRHLPATLTLIAGSVAGLLSMEFFLTYWPAPRLRLASRWLNGAAALGMLAAWMFAGHGLVIDVYLPYAAAFGVLCPSVWAVAVRELRKSGWPPLGTILFVASLAYIGSAAYELVTDALGLPSYRLFSYGITTCAWLAGSVVVAEFLKLGQVNERLNVELSRINGDLQAALERSREVERLKMQFLASVTHELRTPLNVIVNVPEGLIEDFASTPCVRCRSCDSRFELEAGERADDLACAQCGARAAWDMASDNRFVGDGDAAVEALRLLERSSKHLLTIVDDLLDSSRLEAGHMQLTLRREPLADVFQEALQLSREIANDGGVELVASERLGDATLLCDRVRLVQIITNLVANAVRFAGDERRVQLGADIESGLARFSVKDWGPGIHPRDQAAIFQIFRQIGAQQHRGAGLGLAIAKRLVGLHGGELSVESEPGRGATFRVVIPLQAASAERPEDSGVRALAEARRSGGV